LAFAKPLRTAGLAQAAPAAGGKAGRKMLF
jgi:hypothetical protein